MKRFFNFFVVNQQYYGVFKGFHVSSAMNQLQRPDLSILAHGAGLSNADSKPFNQQAFQNPFRLGKESKPADPTYDMQITNVYAGLGTNPETDPYTKTLPNVQMISPISTTISSFRFSPTVNSLNTIRQPLGNWIESGDLIKYINTTLKIILPSSLSSRALEFVNNFKGEGIKEICIEYGISNENLFRSKWVNLSSEFFSIPIDIFDPWKFSENIQKCRQSCLDLFLSLKKKPFKNDELVHSEENHVPEELLSCIDYLVKIALDLRNKMIDDVLSPLVIKYSPRGHTSSNKPFDIIMDYVLSNKNLLFTDSERKNLLFKSVEERNKSLPSVSAPVALFCILLSNYLITNNSKNVIFQNIVKTDISKLLSTISPMEKKALADEYLSMLLNEPTYCFLESMKKHFLPKINHLTNKVISDSMKPVKTEIISLVAMVIAEKKTKELITQGEIKPFIPLFSSPGPVRAVFTYIYENSLREDGQGSESCRSRFKRLLRLAKEEQLKNITETRWADNYQNYAQIILTDQILTKYFSKAIAALTEGSANLSEGVLSRKVLFQLKLLIEKRNKRLIESKNREFKIRNELLSLNCIDHTLNMIKDALIDDHEKNCSLISKFEDKKTNSMSQSSDLQNNFSYRIILNSLNAIRLRHPHWVEGGVVPLESTIKNINDMVIIFTQIFFRLNFIPNVFEARMQNIIRGRIGHIGTTHYEHNICVEMGKTEFYDTHLYKTYDPQGWYQRMRDIDNRNVSLKVGIKELYTLEHNRGDSQFVDLQTERRLRVLAGDKIGNSILKLDCDRYEDVSDNINYVTMKVQQIFSESKKAQLGKIYWPSVEIKVRKPSGQSQTLYSLIDYDRIEDLSKKLYKEYKKLKLKSLFVSPTDTYLKSTTLKDGIKPTVSSLRKRSTEGYVVNIHDDNGE